MQEEGERGENPIDLLWANLSPFLLCLCPCPCLCPLAASVLAFFSALFFPPIPSIKRSPHLGGNDMRRLIALPK
jgi:hypothetical protein